MDFDQILKYKKAEEKNYYELLGCDELSSAEQIICEFKLRSLKCHPDKNIGDPNAVLCFKKLLRAKEVLSDPETRLLYDKWLKSGLSMPFEQFLNLNKACHTSIHWVCKKKKEAMLEYPCGQELNMSMDGNQTFQENKDLISQSKRIWERDSGSELVCRFRNYEV